MDLLRLTTAGSVDDGKSTLIGRLLYDSKSIFEDQMDHIKRSGQKRGLTRTDLALVTDGLRDEREQGITIDVAYRYFATPSRKFIMADSPGHIQYTRNMVTGASTAHTAVILIDARKGVSEQTFRHTYIASLLNIPELIICVNKMDLVDYQVSVFNQIREDVNKVSSRLPGHHFTFIPISALLGDNVVNKSKKMNWYKGDSLLRTLETIKTGEQVSASIKRFSVQSVFTSNEENGVTYLAGQVSCGIFRVGDKVKIFPSESVSRICELDQLGKKLQEVFAPMSIAMRLEDDLEISRGDLISGIDDQPLTKREFEAMVCWFGPENLSMEESYEMYCSTSRNKIIISHVSHKIDVNTMAEETDFNEVKLNDICKVSIKTLKPLSFDSFRKSRQTGSFILVNNKTNETVAAGMIS